MHYYQHNIGDYRKDTIHLTLLEHGIYRQLLDLYYTTERPLDASALRLICARSPEEKEAAENILQEFFTKRNGKYFHARCDIEIKAYYDKKNKARTSAEIRWNENNNLQDANAMRTQCERNANGMLTNNHKPLTNNQDKIEKKYTKKEYSSRIEKPDCLSEQTWLDFQNHRKAKKAPITQTVIDRFAQEASLAGITLEQAINESIFRNWQGFKAEWYLKDNRNNNLTTTGGINNEILREKGRGSVPVGHLLSKLEAMRGGASDRDTSHSAIMLPKS